MINPQQAELRRAKKALMNVVGHIHLCRSAFATGRQGQAIKEISLSDPDSLVIETKDGRFAVDLRKIS